MANSAELAARICKVPACTDVVGLRGKREMCNKHYLRWYRYGDVNRVGPPGNRGKKGAENGMWKGDEASYWAMHMRVRTARGKADHCLIYGCTDTGPFQWANISGNYGDVADYMPMCCTHHRQYDDDRRGYHLTLATGPSNLRLTDEERKTYQREWHAARSLEVT